MIERFEEISWGLHLTVEVMKTYLASAGCKKFQSGARTLEAKRDGISHRSSVRPIAVFSSFPALRVQSSLQSLCFFS